ncbi:2OG-Fe(II) oxygenase [Komagataeibacter xylinus]|uniref:2OG-Fe(II) oxygenase n=1 Tax=Komagataeibacter xylinus TaxID=28448 RepID=A0A857FQB0_KOMXY|nr:2OG-Fe(II) oxygenase [Komagataeibacter xylinus]QHC36385.1 2OG-Fe(II) oxygenase [Komagataeibacter xylinus]
MSYVPLLKEMHRSDTSLLSKLAQEFTTARPFPHLVIDGMFSHALLNEALQAFNLDHVNNINVFQNQLQSKRSTSTKSVMPAAIQQYFDIVNSAPFLRLLTRLTGITNLLPDPYFYGGGMHEVAGEGHFQVHTDFRHHPHTYLENRLVLLTYLNHDWKPEYGGLLELWQKNPPQPVRKIVPRFGRSVLMLQSPDSWHGHPQATQAGHVRRTLITYFYTAPKIKTSRAAQNTTYLSNNRQSTMQIAEIFIRNIMPHFIIDTARWVRHRKHKQNFK